MSGLMTSFNVGVTGLRGAQTGVNTTSHNLVNVSTEGYSRQRVNYVDRGYNNVGTSYINTLQIGLGTEINRISQVRDVFYDKAYRLEVGRKNFYEVQSDAVGEIENLMGEMNGVEFQTTLSDLWKAVQELAKEPDSVVKQTSLVNTANTFMLRAQDVYEQLKDYQLNLNQQIKDAVKRVNEIGAEIFEMNKQIVKAESGNEIANDYRDRRNMLLDELSEYASSSYHEDVDGPVLVYVEGTMFVSQDFVYEMQTVKKEENNLLDVTWGEDVPVFNLSQGFSSELNTDVGKIKSLLFARGEGVCTFADIPDEKDPKFSPTGTFDPELYAKALTEYNNTTNSSIVASTEAYFDKLVHAVVTAVNDALSPNKEVKEALASFGLVSEDKIEVTGLTGENLSGDEITNLIAKMNAGEVLILDEYNAGIGCNDAHTLGAEIFSRQSVDRYQKVTITYKDKDSTDPNEEIEKTIYIYNQENKNDTYSLYTIDQLVINRDVLDNPSILPTAANNYKGDMDGYDVDVCKRLQDLWLDNSKMGTLDPNDAVTFNILDYYTGLIGNIATLGKEYTTTAETEASLVNSIDDNRSSVSGVSSDEELTNLIQYQYAYVANSKYITTIDQMLEDLLNKLG